MFRIESFSRDKWFMVFVFGFFGFVSSLLTMVSIIPFDALVIFGDSFPKIFFPVYIITIPGLFFGLAIACALWLSVMISNRKISRRKLDFFVLSSIVAYISSIFIWPLIEEVTPRNFSYSTFPKFAEVDVAISSLVGATVISLGVYFVLGRLNKKQIYSALIMIIGVAVIMYTVRLLAGGYDLIEMFEFMNTTSLLAYGVWQTFVGAMIGLIVALRDEEVSVNKEL